MIYQIKFLCNNDIYTVGLTVPKDIYNKETAEEKDYLLNLCIETEKEIQGIMNYPHTIVEIARSIDNINWEDMI